MPNRLIRAELLESEAWLALKDNADRCAWISAFLTADNFGDMPAGPHRLVKLWRPFGIDTPEKASKVLADLADVDLVRRYEINGKPYLHIPRFGQELKYVGSPWPLSPWATIEEKQRFEQKYPAKVGESLPDVDLDVDVDQKRTSTAPKPAPVDNSVDNLATWAEHWKAQGRALEIQARHGESEGDYCRRVQALAKTRKT